jgi:hypothetical protein
MKFAGLLAITRKFVYNRERKSASNMCAVERCYLLVTDAFLGKKMAKGEEIT